MFSPKRDETRPGYEMRKEHIAIGVMILLCLPTVSYTHLDVYKRQIIRCCSMAARRA